MDVNRRKKTTINDVARLSGVSKKTVSRVINQSPMVHADTRLKVQKVIDETGFKPDPLARGLAFRRSFLLGLVYDNPTPQYVVNIQQGILDVLAKVDFGLIVRPADRTQPQFVAQMMQFVNNHKLDGVILPPSVSEDEALIEAFRQNNTSHIRIASVGLDNSEVMIVTHDRLGALDAARHLASLGHRVIGHIAGRTDFRSATERRHGFATGLAEAGIGLPESQVENGAYTFESGMAAARILLERHPDMTAIFAGNDEMAAGAYSAIRALGLNVPEDVSIVGFDDSPQAARMYPALSSVRLPIRQMGQEAAVKLLNIPSLYEDFGPFDAIRPTLIERESTAPPKHLRAK